MATRAHAEDPEEGIRVELMTLGGEIKSVLLNGAHTVADALRAAGFPENSEVRIKGEIYKGDDELEDGDKAMVLAGAKVKGGNA